MKTFDFILQGSEATEDNARLACMSLDWSEQGISEQELPNKRHVDTVQGIEIYYDFGADYYFFAPSEDQSHVEAMFNYITASLKIDPYWQDILSSQGNHDYDVIQAMNDPEIKPQLTEIDPEELRKELSEYGAWNDEELSNHHENLKRILWIKACDLAEYSYYG